MKLTETTFKACLINDVIDDLILHAWKRQFDCVISLFCTCAVLKVGVLLTSLATVHLTSNEPSAG